MNEESYYKAAQEAADKAKEEAAAAGRLVADPSREQRAFWSRCQARASKGAGWLHGNEKAGLQALRTWEKAKAGGVLGEKAARLQAEANQAWEAWQEALRAEAGSLPLSCPHCGGEANFTASPLAGESFCRGCWQAS